MEVMRVVTLAGDPEREAELAPRLALEPSLDLYMRCIDRVELLATVRSGTIDAIVSVGAPGWFDVQAAREAARGGIRLVGVVDNALETEVLERLGVSVLDANASVGQIVDACRSAQPAAPISPVEVERTRSGQVVAIWGPKGAPGRTTLAIELSYALAGAGETTVLVDADPYGGDALQMLGVVEELPTILWAATAAASDRGRGDILNHLRKVGANGPLLVPGLPRAELWTEVDDFGYGELIKLLAAQACYVIVDVGFCLEDSGFLGGRTGRNAMARATLERADRVIAVCRADAVGVKNFIWSFESLRELIDDDRLSVVLNRLSVGDRREVDELLLRHTGRRSTLGIPDRPHDCRKAVERGGALHEVHPSSDICDCARVLAEQLGGRVRPRGVLARLAGRS
jgi:MinD-like ATPase involved in chromosome partitioning or flagellar assembly